jgi:hypothetical protein
MDMNRIGIRWVSSLLNLDGLSLIRIIQQINANKLLLHARMQFVECSPKQTNEILVNK